MIAAKGMQQISPSLRRGAHYDSLPEWPRACQNWCLYRRSDSLTACRWCGTLGSRASAHAGELLGLLVANESGS